MFGNLKGGEELLALRDHGQVVNFLDVSKVKGPSEDLLRLLVFGPKGCHDRIEKVTKQYVSGLD